MLKPRTALERHVQQINEGTYANHKGQPCTSHPVEKEGETVGAILEVRQREVPPRKKFCLVYYGHWRHAQWYAESQAKAQQTGFLDAREPQYEFPGSMAILNLWIHPHENHMEIEFVKKNFRKGTPAELTDDVIESNADFRETLIGHAVILARQNNIRRIRLLVQRNPTSGKTINASNIDAFRKKAEEHGFTFRPPSDRLLQSQKRAYAIAELT